jgi:hypothetical protein
MVGWWVGWSVGRSVGRLVGRSVAQYPSPLCSLKWAVTHVIGLHIELTILGEYGVASTTIVVILISI